MKMGRHLAVIVLLSVPAFQSVASDPPPRSKCTAFIDAANVLRRFPKSRLFADTLPIENFYPRLKIKNGQIPYGSKAFIAWRNSDRTPQRVPDVAFLARYLGDEQTISAVKDNAGILELELATDFDHSELLPSSRESINRFFEAGGQLVYYNSRGRKASARRSITAAKKLFDSPEEFQRILRVKFELTLSKYKKIISSPTQDSYRFFIDKNGTLYVFSADETQLIYDIIGYRGTNDHAAMADLIFWGQAPVPIISEGHLITFPKPRSTADIHVTDFANSKRLPGVTFKTKEYIESYFEK